MDYKDRLLSVLIILSHGYHAVDREGVDVRVHT